MKNSTMQALCLILLFCLLSIPGFTQKNFVSGFVVLNSGDTLKGLISDEDWKINPKVIHFKVNTEDHVRYYTPLTIRMFRVTNANWYVSYTGEVDGSSLRTTELKFNPAPPTVMDTLFLRVLVSGKTTLFYARDHRERDHFFIQQKDSAVTELIYNKFLIKDYQGTHIKVNEAYRSQLVQLVSDCAELSAKIMGIPMEYKRDAFTSLIQQYNNCAGGKPVYVEEKEKWDFGFSVIAGINYSGLTFKGGGGTFFEHITMGHSLGYAAGISFNAIIPRNRKKWSITNDLFLKNYTAYGNTVDISYEPDSNVYMSFQYLKLATTLRYSVPKGLVRPFACAGMTNAYALKYENTRKYSNGHTDYLIDGPKRYEFGVIAGAGVTVKKFTIEGLIESSSGMSPFILIHTRFTTLYGLIGYTF